MFTMIYNDYIIQVKTWCLGSRLISSTKSAVHFDSIISPPPPTVGPVQFHGANGSDH